MTPNFDVKLPFTLASDNEELEKNIMEFDRPQYDQRLDEFHEKVGLVFDGRASKNLADLIIRICECYEKDEFGRI